MKAYIIPVTPFAQNCSLLCCEASGKAALVDPGGEIDRLVAAAEEAGCGIEKILLTHGHLDHVGGAGELAHRLGVPIEGPQQEDRFWLDRLAEQSQMFGFPPVQPFTPDRWLEQGDTVRFGTIELAVRHCPGHTPGHVVFYQPDAKLAIVGDVLFQGSIGRTDFPRGDFDTLIHSIREQLLTLPDEVQFIPGHGPTSTIGAERRNNPFIGGRPVV